LETKFDGLEVQFILRKHNLDADTLASRAAERQHLLADDLVEVLTKPSIPINRSGPNPTLDPMSDELILSKFLGKSMLGDTARATALVGNRENWMEPIQTYLTNQTILDDDANIK
jgi:hypothetical protein